MTPSVSLPSGPRPGGTKSQTAINYAIMTHDSEVQVSQRRMVLKAIVRKFIYIPDLFDESPNLKLVKFHLSGERRTVIFWHPWVSYSQID